MTEEKEITQEEQGDGQTGNSPVDEVKENPIQEQENQSEQKESVEDKREEKAEVKSDAPSEEKKVDAQKGDTEKKEDITESEDSKGEATATEQKQGGKKEKKQKPEPVKTEATKAKHPENYRHVVFQDMSNGIGFLTRSTVDAKETIKWEDGNEYPLVKMEISNTSHPFYTGKMKFVDTAGRVDKFMNRYKKHIDDKDVKKKSDQSQQQEPVAEPEQAQAEPQEQEVIQEQENTQESPIEQEVEEITQDTAQEETEVQEPEVSDDGSEQKEVTDKEE